ncbi:IucA/IucC family C-terminal-domain containing protein [Polymorphospora rubra]|uniref:IucA/IucC family C-terminal-domain containing protein n=1 Tax=Polymorphospora rubra TaxID=338584 RepID=UPI0033E6AC13
MTAAVDLRSATGPLGPVTATLRATFGTDDLPGLAPGLLVDDERGWRPATELVDGSHLPELLAAARQRWGGSSHAATALAWKAYVYWLALPAVLGWASARRVPLPHPSDVLVAVDTDGALVRIGLRRSTTVAVLPGDPLALAGLPEVEVVAGETELLAALRGALVDSHVTPMLDAIHEEVRLGTRTLLGSLASGVAHAVLRAADVLPGSSAQTIRTLLSTFGVDDLVDLVAGPNGELTVQRRTCCLAFTLPRPKVCAGCCIRPERPETTAIVS